MEIVESILTKNRSYLLGTKIKVIKGLMLHSVGCPQPNAAVFARNWNNAKSGVSVHAFIDGNTGKVYQTLPWDRRAWHCGSGARGSANNTHIGVEMCEPACIKYTKGANFTCSNHDAAVAVVKRTYDTAVELFAYLCERYKLDPEANGVIISHNEGRIRGVASSHVDPEHLWKGLQCGYTMDGFRQDVKKALDRRKQEAQKTQPAAAPQTSPQSQPTVATQAKPQSQPVVVTQSKPQSQPAAAAQAKPQSQPAAAPQINPQNQPTAAPQTKPQSEQVMPQKTDAASSEAAKVNVPGEMSVSDKGVELIAGFEGCRLEAYQCAAGVWTIGYGHTADVHEGDTLPSKEAAKELLKKDLKVYGGHVNDYVKKGIISFPLNQNQFDALTSFCYNCGSGNLKRLVSNRDAATVAGKILLYTKSGGRVLDGLVERRKKERLLFLS